MHFIFLSCLRTTGLIEKRLCFRLSFKERIQVRMHLTMCNACKNYDKQSAFLDTVLKYPNSPAESSLDFTDFINRLIFRINISGKDGSIERN